MARAAQTGEAFGPGAGARAARRSRARRRTASALLTSALVVGLGLGLAPSSTAREYLNSGVAIRSAQYTSSTILGRGYPGQEVIEYRTGRGSTYSYNNAAGQGRSNLWSSTRNTTTNVSGWSGFWFIH